MGYLNKQLYKVASLNLAFGSAGALAGASIGARHAQKEDKLAGLIGGGLGGSTGTLAGMTGALKLIDKANLEDDFIKLLTNRAVRNKALKALGILTAGTLGGGFAGTVIGSESAKKLKKLAE